MADPARQPERVRNETARRALRARGPQLVQALRALSGDRTAAGAPIPVSPLGREQILEQALGAMSRESARLLYLGAKSALEADPVYRVLQDRSPGGDPEPWPVIRERAETLERRGVGLGAPTIQRWPRTQPGADAHSGHLLASECVDLAEAIRPGWEWTQLMRGIVLKSRGRYDEALACLRPLAETGFDYEVRYSGLRNCCAILIHAPEHAPELADKIEALLHVSKDDEAAPYLSLELNAMRHDSAGFGVAQGQLAERVKDDEAKYWLGVLRSRSSTLAERAGLPDATFAAWLEDLES